MVVFLKSPTPHTHTHTHQRKRERERERERDHCNETVEATPLLYNCCGIMCDKRQLTHPHMALNYLEPTQNLNQKKKRERELILHQ